MDHGACNVVYLDRRARENETIKRDMTASHPISGASGTSSPRPSPGYFDLGRGRVEEVQANLQAILSTFHEGTPWPNRLRAQMAQAIPHLQLR